MDRGADLDRLPLAYAVALRLHDAGARDDVIAVALGLEPASVPTTLELARRKLEQIDEARDD